MTKGISPLVASVLLIAATMSIAGILAYWASNFTKMQTSQFENQTTLTRCSGGNIEIYSCNFNRTTNVFNIILRNTGQIDLTNLVGTAIYPNGTVSPQNLTGTLSSSGSSAILSFNIVNISSDLSKIIITTNCPNVEVEKAAYQC